MSRTRAPARDRRHGGLQLVVDAWCRRWIIEVSRHVDARGSPAADAEPCAEQHAQRGQRRSTSEPATRDVKRCGVEEGADRTPSRGWRRPEYRQQITVLECLPRGREEPVGVRTKRPRAGKSTKGPCGIAGPYNYKEPPRLAGRTVCAGSRGSPLEPVCWLGRSSGGRTGEHPLHEVARQDIGVLVMHVEKADAVIEPGPVEHGLLDHYDMEAVRVGVHH